MSALNLFIPLTKIDEENRLVYGVVAAEVVDNSGEVFDYDRSKPYFQKWSLNAEITSNGLSKGNLREMHGKSAAGKLTDLAFDDDNRVIECCAKVVDDMAWKKCLEGVYTGFSMGGRYAEKWVEKVSGFPDQKRYAGDPAEISLVDKPCIPTATFSLIKADGVVEDRHFATTTEEELLKASQPRVPGGSARGGQFASSKGSSSVFDAAMAGGSSNAEAVSNLAKPEIRAAKKDPATLRQIAERHRKTASNIEKEYRRDEAAHDPSKPSRFANPKDKNVAASRAEAVHNMRAAADLMDAKATAWESKLGKSDGDTQMTTYIPTNDETFPVAQSLAKAAGSNDWMAYMELAREQIVSAHLAKADGDEEKPKEEAREGSEDKGDFDPDAEKGPGEDGTDDGTPPASEDKDDDEGDEGEGDEDKEAAEKADAARNQINLEQVWKTSDGQTFLKKADAVAHQNNLTVEKADDAAEPSLLDLAKAASAAASEILSGEGEGEGQQDDRSELIKYADFFDGFVKFDGVDQVLEKSMYTVERMARVLRDVGSLQIAVSREQKREGDDSETPGMIGIAVSQLGETLIEMAKEEVGELLLQVANDGIVEGIETSYVGDCYYELSASTLGLEKSDVDELAKAAGSKNSEYVQKVHDRLAKMGAKCSGVEGLHKVDGADELAKMSTENDELRKDNAGLRSQIDEAMPMLKSLMDDMAKIKAMPVPSAPRTLVMEKADDVRGVQQVREEASVDLAKFTPDQLADAAIRMAQKGGVLMTSRGSNPR